MPTSARIKTPPPTVIAVVTMAALLLLTACTPALAPTTAPTPIDAAAAPTPPPPSATPASTPTLQITTIPSPTPTASPIPTFTPSPTPTRKPTPSPTPTATVEPTPPLLNPNYEKTFVNIENRPYTLLENGQHTIYFEVLAPTDLSEIDRAYRLAIDTIQDRLRLPIFHHPDIYVVTQVELVRYANAAGANRAIFIAGFRTRTGIYISPQPFSMENIVEVMAHELAHEAVNAVNPAQNIPPWLNEGLAELVGVSAARAQVEREPTRIDGWLRVIRTAMEEETFYGLEELEAWTWRSSPDRFAINQGYAQGWAFATYFFDTHGADTLHDLIASIAGGGALPHAVEATTSQPFDTVWDGYLAAIANLLETD